MAESELFKYNVTIVGYASVGKSAITARYTFGNFIQKYDPTIEDSFTKSTEFEGKCCLLEIMDTAGQEEYGALRDEHMRKGDGFLVVYSVIAKHSFVAADKLRRQIARMRGQDFPVVLLGNKCDLTERQVTLEEGVKLGQELGVPFLETSAMTELNIVKAFETLIKEINKYREVHPSEKQKKKKSGCMII